MQTAHSDFLELTVADAHARMQAGTLRCADLVDWYLDRIRTHDQAGASLGAVVNVNPNARDEAVALDAARAGAAFPELCDALFAISDNEEAVPLRAATLIKRWVADGMIGGLVVAAA